MNRRNFLKGTLNGAIALAISPGVVLSEEESGNKFLDENDRATDFEVFKMEVIKSVARAVDLPYGSLAEAYKHKATTLLDT